MAATPPGGGSTQSSLQPFSRRDFEQAPRTVLRDGRWANARVFRVDHAGRRWVVKDFAPRAAWVRNTAIRRMVRAPRACEPGPALGIDGVPPDAFRLDACALAFGYVDGLNYGKAPVAVPAYFIALEALMRSMHARGIVHLDNRGSGNVLVRPDGSPALIDFQSAVSTRGLPACLRNALQAIDLTGVYKKWQQADAASMGADRLALFGRVNRWRHWWVLRGYAGARKPSQPPGPPGPPTPPDPTP